MTLPLLASSLLPIIPCISAHVPNAKNHQVEILHTSSPDFERQSDEVKSLALGPSSGCSFPTLEDSGHPTTARATSLLTHDHMNSHVQKAAVDSEASTAFGPESAQRVISRPYAA